MLIKDMVNPTWMAGRVQIDVEQMVQHIGTSGTVIKTKVAPLAPLTNFGYVLNQFVS